jgi:hypothetical protein
MILSYILAVSGAALVAAYVATLWIHPGETSRDIHPVTDE